MRKDDENDETRRIKKLAPGPELDAIVARIVGDAEIRPYSTDATAAFSALALARPVIAEVRYFNDGWNCKVSRGSDNTVIVDLYGSLYGERYERLLDAHDTVRAVPFAIARALACAFAIPGWRERARRREAEQAETNALLRPHHS